MVIILAIIKSNNINNNTDMKSKLILYFILVISLSSKGQEFSKEFGKLGNAEVNLTQYTKDSSAEAVDLFDMGESLFASTEKTDLKLCTSEALESKFFRKRD